MTTFETTPACDTDLVGMLAATTQYARELPQLSSREKALLMLVADLCNQTLGRPFREHVADAVASGLTYADIRDALRGVAFETGYPAATAAFDALAGIERAAGLPLDTPVPVPDTARPPIMVPSAVRAMWYEVDEGFGVFMELQASLVSGSSRLTPRERAFAAIMCDVQFQTLQETFRLHISRALTAGVDPEDLRAVLRFGAQFGVARIWNAFSALAAHLESLLVAPSEP